MWVYITGWSMACTWLGPALQEQFGPPKHKRSQASQASLRPAGAAAAAGQHMLCPLVDDQLNTATLLEKLVSPLAVCAGRHIHWVLES